jgi:hypothetical protein
MERGNPCDRNDDIQSLAAKQTQEAKRLVGKLKTDYVDNGSIPRKGARKGKKKKKIVGSGTETKSALLGI